MKDYLSRGVEEYMDMKSCEKDQYESVVKKEPQFTAEVAGRGMVDEERKSVKRIVRGIVYKWKDAKEAMPDYYQELIAVNTR